MSALLAAEVVTATPDVVPVDPESLDATRPADIDVCIQCMGAGFVSLLIEDEWESEECWACDGTGQQRGAA
jgi:hypothetical protein